MLVPIGKRIKKARQSLELTQEQVAKMVGFSRQALSKIEKGQSESPDPSNLVALARALKNNFEEDWLTEYASKNPADADKQAIIKEMPVEEILSIKFPGDNPRRSKKEMLKLRDYLNSKLEEMSDEE